MKNCIVLIIGAASMMFSSAAASVVVTNPSTFPRTEVLEINPVDAGIKVSKYYGAVNETGDTLPVQIAANGNLLFKVDLAPYATAGYDIVEMQTPAPGGATYGMLYTQRDDDWSWENDLVGFRAYGPAKREKNERLFGYDLWLKRPSKTPVLPVLYAMDINPLNWEKVDSLRKIDDTLAEEEIKTFSYHQDHGIGFDCYAVGPTLGACTAAIIDPDTKKINYPWNFEKVVIIENGPLRTSFKLIYPKMVVGGDTVVESRLITLDEGSRVNRVKVRYEGLTKPVEIATGMVLHDETPTYNSDKILIYSDPTQGSDNGRIILGAVNPNGFDKQMVIEDNGYRQLVGFNTLQPGEDHEYLWGYSWTKVGPSTQGEWLEYLREVIESNSAPLRIRFSE